MGSIMRIENVQVFQSNVNYHDGRDIGPGFALIINPHPTNEYQVWQIAQKIWDVLEGMKLEDE